MRDILNLPNGMGRSIINLPNTINIAGTEPVEVIQTDSNTSVTISLKGLSGFTADKIIKVNSAGDALEYADETDTVYTLQSPLSFISGTKIQIDQSLFSTETEAGFGLTDFIPIFKADGTTFKKIVKSEFLLATSYQSDAPITTNNALFKYELDFSTLNDFGEGAIADAAEFILSTDGVKTFRALTFLKLKTSLGVLSSVASPLALSGTEIFINPDLYNTLTSIEDNDFIPFFDETGIVSNRFARITFALFKNQITTTALDFGTVGSDVSTRFLGKATAALTLNATNFNLLATNTFLRAIVLNNLGNQNDWNHLLTFRRALSSTEIAFKQGIYDKTSGGTNVNNFWGLFSDVTQGPDVGFNPIIECRDDGQIVLRGNITVANPGPAQGSLVALLNFNPMTSSSYLNKYVPYIKFGLSHTNKTHSFVRWTFATATGNNFTGFNYVTETTSTDIMSFSDTGTLAILGTYASSDKRIKKDIVDADLDECISVMKSIKLKKYKYTDAYQETYKTTKEEVYGFLADDILENEYLNYCGDISQMPKNLKNGEVLNDFKTIEKSKILTVLWGCCNSQQNKIEEQQTEIELLKSEIANIKSHLNL